MTRSLSLSLIGVVCTAVLVAADLDSMFSGDRFLLPIEYTSRHPQNAVTELNASLQAGAATLSYDAFGYLTSTGYPNRNKYNSGGAQKRAGLAKVSNQSVNRRRKDYGVPAASLSRYQ
jgi:hypothetical protein